MSQFSPYKHSTAKFLDGTRTSLAGDNGVVPVATSVRLIIVIVDHDTVTFIDVLQLHFVSCSRSDARDWQLYRWVLLIAGDSIIVFDALMITHIVRDVLALLLFCLLLFDYFAEPCA